MEKSVKRKKSAQTMLRWISKSYEMSPAALAKMFQKNARTLNVWFPEPRTSSQKPDAHTTA
jgi:hypothetical protein